MKGRFQSVPLTGSLTVAILFVRFLTSAHPGNGMVALSETTVFTGDAVHSCLWRFELGRPPLKLSDGQFHCHWVTRSLDGELYSETLANRSGKWTDSVYRMDSQGKNPIEIATGGEGSFGIFAVGASNGIIHEAESAIVLWSDGRNSPFRGSGKPPEGEPPLEQVTAFAWGPGGVLLLADGAHIRKIGPDGVVRLVATIGGPVTDKLYAGTNESVRLWGLAVDEQARVLAAVPSNSLVLRLEKDGSQHVLARTDDGWAATGVATFGQTIFLYECKTVGNRNLGPRIRMLKPDGKFVLVGTAGE